MGTGGFPSGSVGKNPLATQETVQEMWVWSLGEADPLEEGMAPHSSIHAWRILWTEEPGGLQSIGLHRVRHNWKDLASTHLTTRLPTKEKKKKKRPRKVGRKEEKKQGRVDLVAFVDIWGITTSTMADFKLPMWYYWTQSWGEMQYAVFLPYIHNTHE